MENGPPPAGIPLKPFEPDTTTHTHSRSTGNRIAKFPPPPRSVERPYGGGCTLLLMRLFMLPHSVVGVVMLLSIPVFGYVKYFGTPVTAIVDQTQTGLSRRGKLQEQIFYHYDLDGRRYDKQWWSRRQTFQQTHVGTQYNGRASVLMGHVFVVGPVIGTLGNSLLGLIAIALFWNAILSVFIYVLWFKPIHDYLIVKFGVAAMANVTGGYQRFINTYRRGSRGTGVFSRLTYSFTAPNGHQYSGRCNVPPSHYQAMPEGAPVLVFYLPYYPRWNLAYNYCDFAVVQ